MLLILHPILQQHWQSQDCFSEIMALQGETFRHERGRRTIRFTLNNKNYFAKIHQGVGWREIFKNLVQLRLPVLSAKQEWQAIQRLSELGIFTMHAVGYGCKGLNPAKRQSFLITEELTNTQSLEDFCRDFATNPPPVMLKWALIKRLAHIARTLHENGINHRDFYLCHFLLESKALNTLKIYVIDLHRAQIRRRVPARWKIKDIGGLYFSAMKNGLTKRDKLRFMRFYRNKPLRYIFQEENAFWQQVQKRAGKLYEKHNRL